jgi:hypothetical protein
MSSTLSTGALRLALLAAGALIAAPALAQDYGAYPPPPPPPPPPSYPGSYYGQEVYMPPAAVQRPSHGYGGYGQQNPYAQGAYNQGPYRQGGYTPQYGQAPSGYDPYAAPRGWNGAGAYQQASAPRPSAPLYAAPPEQAAAPPAATLPEAPPSGLPAAPTSAPAVEAPPPAVQAAAPPPPRPVLPPAPNSVALSHRVVESAAAYLGYIDKASALSPAFTDGVGVAKELKVGAAYEPKQFEEGAIAYAAIEALQEPAFVEGVRRASGGDPDRAAEIAVDLMRNPASAATFSGADAAAARASAALRRQGDRLLDAGTKMKQAAYDVQHSDWSKGDIVEPEVRLAAAKTLSATRITPEKDETDKLVKLVLAEQGGAYAVGEGASPAVTRGLALAALAVLGQAGEDKTETVASLMAEEKDGECLKLAKLNLFQCLAVSGPHYEDIFCLGQHAMMETAQCMIKSSGVSHPVMTASAAPVQTPLGPMAPAPAAMTPAPQDYRLPVAASAGSSGGGR